MTANAKQLNDAIKSFNSNPIFFVALFSVLLSIFLQMFVMFSVYKIYRLEKKKDKSSDDIKLLGENEQENERENHSTQSMNF